METGMDVEEGADDSGKKRSRERQSNLMRARVAVAARAREAMSRSSVRAVEASD